LIVAAIASLGLGIKTEVCLVSIISVYCVLLKQSKEIQHK
jgi:hypothetical protein